MQPRRIILFVLAGLLMIPVFLLTTTDVFVNGTNCGAALFPKDTKELIQDTGDVAQNDFNAEVLSDTCGRDITRQRFFAGILVVLAIVLVVLGYRWKPSEPRFPGDPVI